MPYTAAHKQRSRERILASALALFTRQGFEQVSINDIMADAGMTRGAFYAHFSSKGDLYAEAVLTATVKNNDVPATEPAAADSLQLAGLIAGYLSQAHVKNDRGGCPLAFLATDIATRDDRVRAAYTRVYKGFSNKIRGQLLLPGEGPDDDPALAFLALLIGGVAVARAINDEALSERVLAACRQRAMAMLTTGE